MVPRASSAGGVVTIKLHIQKEVVSQKSPLDQNIIGLTIETGTKIQILREV